ncbi:porin [Shewanella sp. Choline-02u-19]|uniref:porin n=1 Tax=unclassified Shewanella TaxID=196818 RepID=UPI000C32C688|nr:MULTISPECIES: porin [unclassified Shewanella]PKG57293.1 porin [Shewanella sp. GutDb-MelDb]PKG75325.1 porin [Shewanella sp. GutCb]PKH57980.1 porin [Shewanella sp. Bg11-22]PKI27471.1 porin [Shewanella sp. Choline-02u-19]
MMKTVQLTLLAAAILASPAVMADAYKFYGRIDYSITNSDSGSATHSGKSGTILENNWSRLGVKGNAALNDDFTVFYQIEVGVNGASEGKQNNPFSARPTFLGIKHSTVGQLAAGRIDPVFKMAKGTADAMDMYSLKHDRLFAGDKRWGDSLEYKTVKWNKLQFGASYILEDNYYAEDDVHRDNGNYQVAVTYGDKLFKSGDFYLAAAYTDGVEDIKGFRAVAQYKYGNLKLGSIYQSAKIVNPNLDNWQQRDGDGFIISAKYQIDKLTLKAQYGQDDSGTGKIAGRVYDQYGAAATDVPEVSQWAIGAEYRLSKSTRVHTELGQFDVKQYSDFDDTIISVGFRIDF